jgi:hypothetical protein
MDKTQGRRTYITPTNERFFVALKYTLFAVNVGAICFLLTKLNSVIDYFMVFVLIVIGVLVLLSGVSTEIDEKNKKFRQGFSLVGKVFGAWIEVQEFSYISIFPTLGKSEQITNLSLLISQREFTTKELKVNLIYNKNRRLQLKEGLKYEKAKSFAVQAREELEIGVYDCTGSETVWIM